MRLQNSLQLSSCANGSNTNMETQKILPWSSFLAKLSCFILCLKYQLSNFYSFSNLFINFYSFTQKLKNMYYIKKTFNFHFVLVLDDVSNVDWSFFDLGCLILDLLMKINLREFEVFFEKYEKWGRWRILNFRYYSVEACPIYFNVTLDLC